MKKVSTNKLAALAAHVPAAIAIGCHAGDDDALPPADDGLDDGEDDGGEPLCTTTTIDVAANPPEVMLVLVTELPLAESRC